MELVLRPAFGAGVAAAVAGAGLVAVAPVASPVLNLPEVGAVAVELTTAAVADFADIPHAAAPVILANSDFFNSLGFNFEHILTGAWNALTALTQFQLADAVHEGINSLANAMAIPQNIALGVVGLLTGDNLFDGIGHTAAIAVNPDMFAGVAAHLQEFVTSMTQSVDQLFQGHLVDALGDFYFGINQLLIEIPEQIVVGSTQFIWQDLLGLP